MVRKSVVIGLGLWVLAVASVAAIAWLAIQTAGSQVSALAVTAPMPSLSGSQAATQAAAAAAPVSPAASSKPTTGAPRPVTRVHFGSISTDGGRVRARCTNATVSLNGGFARPEPGWQVNVRADDPGLWVMFGSQSRAIAVLAKCAAGRPAFTQHSESLGKGASVPDPGPSIQDVPAPAQTAAPTAQPLQRPTAQPLLQPLPSGTPSGAAQPDPAQVAAYVSAQNDMCAQSGWSTDWCRTWQAMSDQERYDQAWQWLTSMLNGGDGAPGGVPARAVAPSGTVQHGPGPAR